MEHAAKDSSSSAAEASKDSSDRTSESSDTPATINRPAPPQMNKMLVSMGLTMLANQVVKRMDKKSPLFLPALRTLYCSSVLVHVGVQQLVKWRIRAANDTTIIEKVTCLLGSALTPPYVKHFNVRFSSSSCSPGETSVRSKPRIGVNV